jgi:hypothetical protein
VSAGLGGDVANTHGSQRLATLASLVVFVLGLGGATLQAEERQGARREFSVAEVKALYPELFVAERTKRGSVSVDVAAPPETHPLAGLLRDGEYVVQYLHGLNGIAADDLRRAAAAPSFPDSYFELLRSDVVFTNAFLEVVHRFLLADGGGIRDYAPAQVRQVELRTALNTAVRFVYPDGIVEGRLRTHICSAFNGLADLRGDRDVFLEALVYSTIFREVHKESPLMDRILAATALAESLDLSTDDATTITRAQGVVWGHLRESDELASFLKEEFDRIGSVLPIALVPVE